MPDATIAMETEILAEEISSSLIRELSREELNLVSGGVELPEN